MEEKIEEELIKKSGSPHLRLHAFTVPSVLVFKVFSWVTPAPLAINRNDVPMFHCFLAFAVNTASLTCVALVNLLFLS